MKHKSAGALLLSVLVILFGALLPWITAKFQDADTLDQIRFDTVSGVQLQFVESNTSMKETMGILCRSTDHVEIPTDMAIRSESDIQLLASQALSHYQDAGLITHDIDIYTQTEDCHPYLMYEKGSGRKSNIFWMLSATPKDGSWNLTLVLDDKTGRLCSITYDCHTEEADEASPDSTGWDLDASLTTFLSLFLSGLGDEFTEFTPGKTESGTASSVDEAYLSTTVSWKDTLSGNCHIVFYMLNSGFYVILY